MERIANYIAQYLVYGILLGVIALSTFTYTTRITLTELEVRLAYNTTAIQRLTSTDEEMRKATAELVRVTNLMEYQMREQRNQFETFRKELINDIKDTQ